MDNLINKLIEGDSDNDKDLFGSDFHSINATKFFGYDECKRLYLEDPSKFKSQYRNVAKRAGLALAYGSSWKLFLEIIPNCTESQARTLYDNFFKGLPRYTLYDKNLIRDAKENGYIKTFLNRLIYIDTLKSDNWKARYKGERDTKNYPVQGSGSDIMKYILVYIYRYIKENKLSRFVGTMRDDSYYTRIITLEESLLTDEVLEVLEKQPRGNCKILLVKDGKPVQEFDRNISMTGEIINQYKFNIYF